MIPRIPGLVPNIPSVGMKASVDFFFDRAAVQSAMSAMDHQALMKSGGLIRDRVRRIIKRRGTARISKNVTDRFPGAGITSLIQMGVLAKTRRGNERAGQRIIREVQSPKGSPAGTPPFTHTPESGHFASYLGFRKNIWFFYDQPSHSVVVGPSKKGRMIPYLHEFGGVLRLRTWVYIPQVKTKRGGMRQPITMKLPTGQRPHNQTHWRPMSLQTVAAYPARPFMKPAMEFCVANGSIAKAFAGQFKSSAGARGTGFTVRRG
jgi:hypothetical protein